MKRLIRYACWALPAIAAMALVGPEAMAQYDYAAEVTALSPAVDTKEIATNAGGFLVSSWLPIALFSVMFFFIVTLVRKFKSTGKGGGV